jgi:hypothetical protein
MPRAWGCRLGKSIGERVSLYVNGLRCAQFSAGCVHTLRYAEVVGGVQAGRSEDHEGRVRCVGA